MEKYTPKFEAFYAVLAWIEGGFTDSKIDLGGTTWYGISSRFLNGIGMVGPVDKETAKQLTYTHFWKSADCESMHPLAAWCYCDALFHHPPAQAAKCLQYGLSIKADGVFGPMTQQSANNLTNIEVFYERYMYHRLRYFVRIVESKPNQMGNMLGWAMRTHKLTMGMIKAGLIANELSKLPWYNPEGYSSRTKINTATGGAFIAAAAVFFPDIDLSSIKAFATSDGTVISAAIAAGVKFISGWMPTNKGKSA